MHQAAVVGGAEYTMFDWFPERRTRLHLVPLAGGPVRTFEAPAYFTFHYINAFETADGRSLCFGVRDAHAFFTSSLTHDKEPMRMYMGVRVNLEASSARTHIVLCRFPLAGGPRDAEQPVHRRHAQ